MKNFEFDPYIYQLLRESGIGAKIIISIGVYITLDCNMYQINPDSFWMQVQRKVDEDLWLNVIFTRAGRKWEADYKYTIGKLEIHTEQQILDYMWNRGQIVSFEIDMP